MAKLPNISNPVAALRAERGMTIHEFANFVGHGAPMLKHVEAGRKPMSDELMDKIFEVTGVPYRLLQKKRWTKKDRDEVHAGYRPLSVQPTGAGCRVFDLLPDLLALYHALQLAGLNPGLALIPLRREIERTVTRWNIEREDLELLSSDFAGLLLGVAGDRQGIDRPFVETIDKHLNDSIGYVLVRKRVQHGDVRLIEAMNAGRALAERKITEARHTRDQSLAAAKTPLAQQAAKRKYAASRSAIINEERDTRDGAILSLLRDREQGAKNRRRRNPNQSSAF
jgi:transcriptional regulator with XRE-family HTH domain